MKMAKCLFCYKEVKNTKNEYHNSCCKKFYGLNEIPVLSFTNKDIYKLAEQSVRKNMTITGVQSKLSLGILKDKKNTSIRLTILDLWGNYIFKPPVEIYAQMPEIEDLTMHLASIYGINTVPHSLIRMASGEPAYISRRIDRLKKVKFHMEDMCQLTGRLTEYKYKGSIEEISRIISQFSSNPGFDLISLFEIVLFSYLVGNADMHLKNFSLIYKDDLIMLAPAYDLLSTKLLISEEEDSALTMNGKKRNFTLNDFKIFAEYLEINSKSMENIFRKFSYNKVRALEFISISFLTEENKRQLNSITEDRYRRLNL